MNEFEILKGDCIEKLKTLPDASVDSCVCDPPYELGFMGKKWDASGIAYSVELWREVLRVLKPGGHLLAFGGTRTYHRMTCAIEDAGFEIRDSIHWLYGTGFPKSLDVSKAIDGAAGAEREVIGKNPTYRKDQEHAPSFTLQRNPNLTAPATDAAKQWQGWGTALKPAHEPVVLARKPLSGTVAANVLEHGTGALNIDATRIATDDNLNGGAYSNNREISTNQVYGEYKRMDPGAFRQPAGRWPANVILGHAEDCGGKYWAAFAAELERDKGIPGNMQRALETFGWQEGTIHAAIREAKKRCEHEVCSPVCPARLIDAQSGNFGDSSGSSRFFKVIEQDVTFRYVAKPSRKERDRGCENLPFKTGGELTDREEGSAGLSNPRAGAGRTSGGRNTHATVKPVQLMRYLVRLVTPPGGIVLDPFTGSGTTGIAALEEGFDFLGIEREEEYVRIAEARIRTAIKEEKVA